MDGRRRGRHRLPGHRGELPGARQGALPRPRRGGGRRDHAGDRAPGRPHDRGRVRGTASGAGSGRRRRPGRTDPARRPQAHRRHRQPARGADEHRRQGGVQPRRRRRRLRRGRRGGRARIPHPDGPPGLHRAARLRGAHRRGRPGGGVVHHPGRLRGQELQRHGAADGPRQDQGHLLRDRRRLRRQDHHLPGTGGDRPGAQGAPARQDGHVARGSVPRHRPHLGDDRAREARRQARRHAGRRPTVDVLRGGRVPRLARGPRRDVRVRLLQDPQLLHRGARRGGQQAQGGRLPGAGRAHVDLRHRVGRRRDRARTGPGPDRDAPEQRGRRGRPGALRTRLRSDRPARDARGGAQPPALQGPAGREPGPGASPAASGSTPA